MVLLEVNVRGLLIVLSGNNDEGSALKLPGFSYRARSTKRKGDRNKTSFVGDEVVSPGSAAPIRLQIFILPFVYRGPWYCSAGCSPAEPLIPPMS